MYSIVYDMIALFITPDAVLVTEGGIKVHCHHC